jgi:hypothetical protein
MLCQSRIHFCRVPGTRRTQSVFLEVTGDRPPDFCVVINDKDMGRR